MSTLEEQFEYYLNESKTMPGRRSETVYPLSIFTHPNPSMFRWAYNTLLGIDDERCQPMDIIEFARYTSAHYNETLLKHSLIFPYVKTNIKEKLVDIGGDFFNDFFDRFEKYKKKYLIAGGSVVYAGCPQVKKYEGMDVDIFIYDSSISKQFEKRLAELKYTSKSMYDGYIQNYTKDGKNVQLIMTCEKSYNETLFRFDINYVRCFVNTDGTDILMTLDCAEAWDKGYARVVSRFKYTLCQSRIEKIKKKGFHLNYTGVVTQKSTKEVEHKCVFDKKKEYYAIHGTNVVETNVSDTETGYMYGWNEMHGFDWHNTLYTWPLHPEKTIKIEPGDVLYTCKYTDLQKILHKPFNIECIDGIKNDTKNIDIEFHATHSTKIYNYMNRQLFIHTIIKGEWYEFDVAPGKTISNDNGRRVCVFNIKRIKKYPLGYYGYSCLERVPNN